MSNFHSSKAFILKRVRLAWADIFTPGEGMNGGEPKYKATALFLPTDANKKLAEQHLMEAARGLWGDNAANMVRSMAANSRFLRNGDNKMADDGTIRPEYARHYFVSASNKSKPQVVAPRRHNSEFVSIGADGKAYVKGSEISEKELGYKIVVPYRGCYVNLKLEAVAGKQFVGQDKKVIPNQVFARLIAVQFVDDGEAFGPGATSAEGFDDEAIPEGAAASADDPFDDDIAF